MTSVSANGGPPAEQLLAEFPVPSYAEWRALVEKDLKGVPFEKRLVTRTYEEIDLQPLYRADDIAGMVGLSSFPGAQPFLRGTEAAGYLVRSWDVAQALPTTDPAQFNELARHALSRGQTALMPSIELLKDLATLDVALRDIDLHAVPLYLQSGTDGLPAAAMLLALAQRHGIEPHALRGAVALDPLGALVHHGMLETSLDQIYDDMAALTHWAAAEAPHVQTIGVNAVAYHEGGGNAVQELAFALATGTAYLGALLERGLDVETVAPRIRFSFAAGTQFFAEVAKFRAARLIWAQAVAAFGGGTDACKLHLHVQTARRHVAALDPHVNILRATIAAFAGIVGGATSLTVGAFDELAAESDELALRVARNTQTLLREEAHLDRVIDPAGGAWFVEWLTDQLARAAWALFQQIEAQGGMAQALIAGEPQRMLASVAKQRRSAATTRRDVQVGVNMYPDARQTPIAVAPAIPRPAAIPQPPASAGGSGGDGGERIPRDLHALATAAESGATIADLALRLHTGEPLNITPVPAIRTAEPFEQLRAAVEGHTARTGERPRVFLATMGPVAQHKPRADFSAGFFQVAGCAVVSGEGYPTPADAAEAAAANGAPIVVICSTDDTYPAIVPPLVQQLKAARPNTIVVLAGYPADQIEAHRAAGVDEFIHIRADVVGTLTSILAKIGVAL